MVNTGTSGTWLVSVLYWSKSLSCLLGVYYSYLGLIHSTRLAWITLLDHLYFKQGSVANLHGNYP